MKRPAAVAAADAAGDRLDIAQQTLLHHVDRPQETAAVAALLRADEEDLLVVLLAGVADELVFFERQRERLLAEDMFAGFQGFDGDLYVPMVGGDDAHHVDVVAVEHLAVIVVGVGFALADAAVVLGPLGVVAVDIADGQDVAEVAVLFGVAGAHAPHANAADLRAIVLVLIGEGSFGREIRHGRADGGRGGAGFEETTAGGWGLRHDATFLWEMNLSDGNAAIVNYAIAGGQQPRACVARLCERHKSVLLSAERPVLLRRRWLPPLPVGVILNLQPGRFNGFVPLLTRHQQRIEGSAS